MQRQSFLASNICAGQYPKPQHWVPTPKGKPYTFIHKPSSTRAGGVDLYIQNCLNSRVCHDICMLSSNCESLWVKMKTNSSKFIYLGVIYRHPNQQFDDFEKDLNSLSTNFNNNEYIIIGDFNNDLLKSTSDNKEGRYYQNLESHGFKPFNH